MFNGKMKAVTFSFDDGVTQDKRLIELLDKYSIKATFNINSELLGKDGQLEYNGRKCSHVKIAPKEVASVYKNHEVAVHTLTHPNLTQIEDEQEIIRQVEQDRLNLSELCGYEVHGMAYPCGGVNNDDRVAKIIKENTGVKFSRTITSNFSFEPQKNLYRFDPTVYIFREFDKMCELADEFLAMKPTSPKIFYLWSHAYEFDFYDDWGKLEEFFKKISGKDDIFYGTNSQVLL